jgi:hypothetical protein
MGEVFELKLRLDGASMNEFGEAVAQIGVAFPAVVLSDAREVETLLKAEEIDLLAIFGVLARMTDNAEAAVKIGDAVATLIGMCEPVRIEGGPVQ